MEHCRKNNSFLKFTDSNVTKQKSEIIIVNYTPPNKNLILYLNATPLDMDNQLSSSEHIWYHFAKRYTTFLSRNPFSLFKIITLKTLKYI
uniref:Uncharacterized protein n=1 Tax=Bartonella schoenbuchensis (strain DSM 13525 / NCTC 13165 / R1) TaxID=687861 RepID=E6Z0B3_BARSR|nr:hypothetical protein B11C_40406 [Bartonella schoenbuchensis R1]